MCPRLWGQERPQPARHRAARIQLQPRDPAPLRPSALWLTVEDLTWDGPRPEGEGSVLAASARRRGGRPPPRAGFSLPAAPPQPSAQDGSGGARSRCTQFRLYLRPCLGCV